MPTYEYECTHCSYTFEVFQRMTDSALKSKCPKCHKPLKRLIGSGAGIIFKGSGFYATDYRKKSPASGKNNIPDKACPKAKEGCQGCPASKDSG